MRKIIVEEEQEKILKTFDKFVLDFFKWIIVQNPTESISVLKEKIKRDNSRLCKVARSTKVKKYLIELVKSPERSLIYFYYKYFTYNYIQIINGQPFLHSNFSDKTSILIKEAFEYFYETLIDTKTFQKEYIPDYTGSKELKREIRRGFGFKKVCPYCDFQSIGHEDYSSIDHFLPKTTFPLLSIYSNNLVVSCAGCNDRIKQRNFKLPIVHPNLDDVSKYIKFLFENSLENITVSYTAQYVIDIRSANAYIDLFKILEVYTSHLYRLKEDRKRIRDSVKRKWNLIRSEKNIILLNEMLEEELEHYLQENILKRGHFGFTKLRMDFCNFLMSEGKKLDLEYLAENLKVNIDMEALSTG